MHWTIKVLLLSLGGALGTNARYWLSRWVAERHWVEHFPLGTFLINVTGSMILGAAVVLCVDKASRESWYLVLGYGFCGGYTTFSTFSWENYSLIRHGYWPMALANIILSVGVAFLALVLAVKTAERLG